MFSNFWETRWPPQPILHNYLHFHHWFISISSCSHARGTALRLWATDASSLLFMLLSPVGHCPEWGHRIHVRAYVHPSVPASVCLRDSAQTASHICTYLVPINWTIIVDVSHTFYFDLDLISDPGQGHKKLKFSCILYVWDDLHLITDI